MTYFAPKVTTPVADKDVARTFGEASLSLNHSQTVVANGSVELDGTATSGSVVVEWPAPDDIFAWDVATFTTTEDGETVDVFAEASPDPYYAAGTYEQNTLESEQGMELSINEPVDAISVNRYDASTNTEVFVADGTGTKLGSVTDPGDTATVSGLGLSAGDTVYVGATGGTNSPTAYNDVNVNYPYQFAEFDVMAGARNILSGVSTEPGYQYEFKAIAPGTVAPEDDGSVWVETAGPMRRGDRLGADPSNNVRFRADLSRADTANNPTLDSVARRYKL